MDLKDEMDVYVAEQKRVLIALSQQLEQNDRRDATLNGKEPLNCKKKHITLINKQNDTII